MTDQEKINKLDALTEIKDRVAGMFGDADGIFMTHDAFEGKRAKEFRNLAQQNQISLAEVENICLGYMYRKGYIHSHIQEQMDEITKFFGAKLS